MTTNIVVIKIQTVVQSILKNKGFNFLEAVNDSPIQLLLEVGTPADSHGCV
jgi:hypothetical protein